MKGLGSGNGAEDVEKRGVGGNLKIEIETAVDQNSDAAKTVSESRAPDRTALNVLALCFALSVLGRGLVESFTVFLLPISESFGWDRARVVSIYSLTALAAGLAAPVAGRLFDRSGPRIVYSAVLGFLIFGELPGLWSFAGMAIIVASSLYLVLTERKR